MVGERGGDARPGGGLNGSGRPVARPVCLGGRGSVNPSDRCPRQGMPLRLKRAYEPADPGDGRRYLIDRLWPRGRSARDLQLAAWRKELSPSDALRRDYCHDPALFPEFRRRYRTELAQQPGAVQELRQEIRDGTVTLVYGARELALSNAAVLAEFLTGRPVVRAATSPRRTPPGPASGRRGGVRSSAPAPLRNAARRRAPRTGSPASRSRRRGSAPTGRRRGARSRPTR